MQGLRISDEKSQICLLLAAVGILKFGFGNFLLFKILMSTLDDFSRQ